MKTYSDEAFDKDLNDFFSHRQCVPAHVQSQIHAKLRIYSDTQRISREDNCWVGIMVLCSVLCMVALGCMGWIYFGQVAIWFMGGIYYFLTMGGMIVMLLSTSSLRNHEIHL